MCSFSAAVSKAFAHPVMLSANTDMGPAIEDVVEVLQEHDIGVESKSFEVCYHVYVDVLRILMSVYVVQNMDAAQQWILGQKNPVVILHREEVSSKHAHRLLANSSNAFMPLSEEEISSYQVFYYLQGFSPVLTGCNIDFLLDIFRVLGATIGRRYVHFFYGSDPRQLVVCEISKQPNWKDRLTDCEVIHGSHLFLYTASLSVGDFSTAPARLV